MLQGLRRDALVLTTTYKCAFVSLGPTKGKTALGGSRHLLKRQRERTFELDLRRSLNDEGRGGQYRWALSKNHL